MKLTPNRIRQSTPAYLGLEQVEDVGGEAVSENEEVASERSPNLQPLPEDDPILSQVRAIIADGFAGVILSGPPGTSKSFFARRLAATLCEQSEERVRFVQFHPSYQYEDFVEAYQVTEKGSFVPRPKVFLQLCDVARTTNTLHVVVIDELSRTDAVRVFGEALTYLEMSQRNIEFELASGRRVLIPKNVFVIATMNPWDRGVDDLDMALERRFAKISLEPNESLLEQMLLSNGLNRNLIDRVKVFFRRVQSLDSPHARIGHAYFARVVDLASLKRLWEYQLSHHFRRAFKLVPEEFETLEAAWNQVIQSGSAEP
jgi:5-methylcytosine-specific restriction protein B